MMKNIYTALFLLIICATLLFVSCNYYHNNESKCDESIGDISERDYSDALSQENASQQIDNSLPWEIPEDIENPSQGLELVESYSKEFGDCYIVVGIGTCEDVDIVIPSTVNGIPVVEIADKAFYKNNKIKSVYCGNRVTTIGKFAFDTCKNLKKVIIPDSVTFLKEQAFASSGVADVIMSDRITKMERAVFANCDSLKSIELPYALTVLTLEMFQNCDLLKEAEMGPNVTDIERDVFASTSLNHIKLPAYVENVDPTSFQYTQLQSFEVDKNNPYLCSVEGVLYSKDMSTLIAYPHARGNYIIPDGVKLIDTQAFYRDAYTSLEVTLPDTMRTVNEWAFHFDYAGDLIVNIKKGLSYIENFAFTVPEGKVTINFEGTKDEWNAIRKAEHWYVPYGGFGNQNTTVKCSDGNLTFNYTMQLG